VDRPALRGATIVFTTAVGVLLLDRLTKAWAERSLTDAPVDLIDGVLTLRFTTNTGGAFSLLPDAPWFFAAASIVACLVIAVMAFRPRPRLHAVAFGLILAGALGNLLDRALRAPGMRGDVVDFIDLHVWPVFNVADVAIVAGVLLLASGALRSEHHDGSAGAAPGEREAGRHA